MNSSKRHSRRRGLKLRLRTLPMRAQGTCKNRGVDSDRAHKMSVLSTSNVGAGNSAGFIGPVGSLFPSAGLSGEIIGQSTAFRQIIEQIETVAPTDATVLIQG